MDTNGEWKKTQIIDRLSVDSTYLSSGTLLCIIIIVSYWQFKKKLQVYWLLFKLITIEVIEMQLEAILRKIRWIQSKSRFQWIEWKWYCLANKIFFPSIECWRDSFCLKILEQANNFSSCFCLISGKIHSNISKSNKNMTCGWEKGRKKAGRGGLEASEKLFTLDSHCENWMTILARKKC